MNKEELKDRATEILQENYSSNKSEYSKFDDASRAIREVIDQLDEPEITELDALNRLSENVQFSAYEIASHLDKLSAYNGKVTYGDQLDEPEKVVVPEFVFNHIEKYKDRSLSLWSAMRDGAEYELKPWMTGTNQDLYARAWLAYPNVEVEEDLGYVIQSKEDTTLYLESFELGVGGHEGWTNREYCWRTSDKKEAEAVACLVNGTVEELEE